MTEMLDNEGIYGKYIIRKTDGSSITSDACYFVLRLDTDPAAQAAMRTYASETKDHKLADDITNCLDELQAPACGCREAMCPHTRIFSNVWEYGEEPEDGK